MTLNYLQLPEFTPLMDTAVCGIGGNTDFGFAKSILSFLPDWMTLSLIALTTTVMLIAFFYMLAAFSQNQQALVHAKTELYEVVVSIAILAVLFMMLNGMCAVKTGTLFPTAGTKSETGVPISWSDKTIYYSATNYLMDFASNTLLVMSIQYRFYMFIDFITSMEISSTPMGMGPVIKPTAGLGAVIKPVLNNAFSAETIAVITAQAQVYIMDFGTYGLLKYFLPFGLVLRSFAPTRRIGGTIIAIVLVFLFVFPLLIISTYITLNDSLRDDWNDMKSIIKDRLGIDNIWDMSKILFETVILKWMWNPEILFASALILMPAIAKIFLGGVFFPVLNTLILVHVARSVSKSLGEEIDITNLTRMI